MSLATTQRIQLQAMAQELPSKATIAFCPPRRAELDGDTVCLERTGAEGSKLAMSDDGQLLLALADDKLDKLQCEYSVFSSVLKITNYI